MPAAGLRNVYACLVHESQECVVDLVRNLRCLDPDSTILLYNGGQDGSLLQPRSCFDKLGARIHPSPRPIEAGNVYQFALDCMQFASDELGFDTLTIVDSDQLSLQSGWCEAVAQQLARSAGDSSGEYGGVGLLGQGIGGKAPERLPPQTPSREAKLGRGAACREEVYSGTSVVRLEFAVPFWQAIP